MRTCQLFPLAYQADPAHYFQQVQAQAGAILLDSGHPVSQRGRFDLISAEPLASITPNPKEALDSFRQRCQQLLKQLEKCQTPARIELPFTGGLMGYLTYELNSLAQCAEIEGLPSATVGLYNWAVISDHQQQRCWLMCHSSVDKQRCAALLALFSTNPIATTSIEPFQLTGAFQSRISAERYQADLE